MRILQCLGHLLNERKDRGERQTGAFGEALAQCSIGGVFHDQKRRLVLQAKLEHANDMGMR